MISLWPLIGQLVTTLASHWPLTPGPLKSETKRHRANMTPASNAHEDLSETDFIFKFNKDLLKFSIVVNTATNPMHAASGYILCKSVNLSTIPHLPPVPGRLLQKDNLC